MQYCNRYKEGKTWQAGALSRAMPPEGDTTYPSIHQSIEVVRIVSSIDCGQ